ncbi:hypothetical protein BU200_05635 [Streptococcus acidominimus]|uniref:Uncharacterized protein n=1 Tax=Streptococcus acidominimus TaxID=1326 RepID=A0A1Q8ED86_STRAI|nr:hypothetical protein BU200_05635 [Streptococcus acidominimus]
MIKLSEVAEEQALREPTLISGLLRRGQKMAISAPKVSLKTSLAIHLAVAIGYGINWLGWQCINSKVLYVNLNISKHECIFRFNKALEHLQLDRTQVANIDILDIPTPKNCTQLINDISQVITGQGYRVVIIDSLDNVPLVTAWQQEDKLSEFDRLIRLQNCCLIFTESHDHRPKGNEEAREMAKWSDSLNYSDILLELFPLKLDPELLRVERLHAVWDLAKTTLNTHNKKYYLMNVTDRYIERETSTAEELRQHLETALNSLPLETYQAIIASFDALDNPIKYRTYWRLETIANSLPPQEAIDNLFYYPILKQDTDKILEFHEPGIEYKSNIKKSEIELEQEREIYTEKLSNGIEQFYSKHSQYPNQKELAETLEVSRQTISAWYKKTGGNIQVIDGLYQVL